MKDSFPFTKISISSFLDGCLWYSRLPWCKPLNCLILWSFQAPWRFWLHHCSRSGKETPVNSSQNHRGWRFVLLFSFSPKERASGRSHTEHWLFLSVAVLVYWNCNELLLFPATLPQWKCASSRQQHKLGRIENDRQWNQPKCCNTGRVPQSSLSTLRENM